MAIGEVGRSILLRRLRRLAEKMDRKLDELRQKQELDDLSDRTRQLVAEEMAKLKQSRIEIGRLMGKLEEFSSPGSSAGSRNAGD